MLVKKLLVDVNVDVELVVLVDEDVNVVVEVVRIVCISG